MSDEVDVFSLPEWKAIHRESLLINQIIGSGITALGRANYANGFGEYYSAFFGLSIGMERLAKLTLIADFACENEGKLPEQGVVRKFGHNLKKLLDQIEAVSISRQSKVSFQRPSDPICKAIVGCLDSFANASVGRYANFESIGNSSFDQRDEPVNKWWVEVVEPILNKHYRGQKRKPMLKNGRHSYLPLWRNIRLCFISTKIKTSCLIFVWGPKEHAKQNGYRFMEDIILCKLSDGWPTFSIRLPLKVLTRKG